MAEQPFQQRHPLFHRIVTIVATGRFSCVHSHICYRYDEKVAAKVRQKNDPCKLFVQKGTQKARIPTLVLHSKKRRGSSQNFRVHSQNFRSHSQNFRSH
jgi:hypothetical protein